jgi:hypothetical protein
MGERGQSLLLILFTKVSSDPSIDSLLFTKVSSDPSIDSLTSLLTLRF